MSQNLNTAIAVIGVDIGKNSFHLVGHGHRGAIELRQKWSRSQVETRLANCCSANGHTGLAFELTARPSQARRRGQNIRLGRT
ncbi:hypothetical protein SAMN05216525_15325 [Bradyrhizobium sp. Gha]|nr:hypothetical protein SAMN05216525_15325 [Bradyrhizobium sp. Gha]